MIHDDTGYEGIDEKHLVALYSSMRSRYAERDDRIRRMDETVRGNWNQVDPDAEGVTPRSPNLIQVALEDTAEAASAMPTLRVTPRRPTVAGKQMAERMEKVGMGYLDHAQMDLLVPQTVMDMAAFGLGAWVVLPDFREGLPVIEWRDPRTCYPEPGLRTGQPCRRALFVRTVHYTQLPVEWQGVCHDFVTDDNGAWKENLNITLVDYFDEHETLTAAMFEATNQSRFGYQSTGGAVAAPLPVVLERIPNRIGICPVVVGTRFTLDKEHRGQFDQIITVLEAHIRLMSMVLDYADQAVYSDVWVKDLIGELSWGGGAYIELGPNGAIGRVPPAVSSFNVQQDLDRLLDAVHLGARYPKSRPGEVDQSIASGKFVEALAGVMNTAIRTYHQILQRMMEHALRVAFEMDRAYFPGKKTISGTLKNQEFVEEYDATKDIDPQNKVRIEYGLGLGRDPAQSAVLMMQYSQGGFISDEFVQENIDGLTDVSRERVRLDLQQLKDMLSAKLLQGVQSGTIPDAALLDIMEARAKGRDMTELFRKYVVEPAEEQAAQALPSGLAEGAGLMAGPPGAQPPGPPGGAPPGMVPPPPEAAEMLSRLNAPVGGGSFLSSNVRT